MDCGIAVETGGSVESSLRNRIKRQILAEIDNPIELRLKKTAELREIADELRSETIAAVSAVGGHLGAGLGVVELTVALHYVFDTPKDRLIWDVGHQAYPHKIMTGRRDLIHTLRSKDGLSGFTKRAESEYDPFGAAHAATSISAALGMCVARDLRGDTNNVVAVIGDGSMSAGMAYEALNNAGAAKSRLVVVLNDNQMSISPAVGALSTYLARLAAKGEASGGKPDFKSVDGDASNTPPANMFEELGFRYIGPVDGHDMDALLKALTDARDETARPVLVHVLTRKGKGYAPAEAASDAYHAVRGFDVASGQQRKVAAGPPSYTSVFAQSLIKEAARDPRIVAVTAAMPAGTGVDIFAESFPDRAFDVGIAEQHAVTFAAGLAAEGYKPFCAIYSTFLQRGYDQVVHDVAIQSLPVRFAIDRAGLVGQDGPTHAGSFDIAYLACLPGFVVMAASDEAELAHMVATAASIDDRPSAIRYPRGDGVGAPLPDIGVPLPIGQGRVVRHGSAIAILSLGARLAECLKAADRLAELGVSATVADARFAKPLDTRMIIDLARRHEAMIIVEEGSIGGFGSHVLQCLADNGVLDTGLRVRSMVLPDVFQAHDTPAGMYAAAGLDEAGIVARCLDALGRAPLVNQPIKLNDVARARPPRPKLKVVLAKPRGFCAGVVRAIDIVERALEKHDEPVFVRHEIVHNRHVVEGLKAKGARFVESLSEIPDGAVAIFSAHGVAKQVEDAAKARGLVVHNATCPLVTKVHIQGRRYAEQGRKVILIGHAGHPEVEATMGQIAGPVFLVRDERDVASLDIANDEPVAYVTQTTLSVDDTKGIIASLHRRFVDVVGPDVGDICYATQNRQEAVRKLCKSVDVLLVVGAANSSNSNRLREIGEELGVPSFLIADSGEIRPEWLENARAIGVTAGASAPETLVDGVIETLSGLRPIDVSTLDGLDEGYDFKLPRELAGL